MSDDSGQQTSLNEIVDEYTEEPEDETVDAGKIQEIDESPVEGWELRRLGEVFSLEYGENLTEDERDGGQYPVYGSNGQVGSHSEAYVDRPGIIVGRKGSIGEVEFSEESFHPIDTTYYISQDETEENLRFVYYLLENVQLSRLNAASAIPGLNRNDAYSLKGLVPPLQEQRKIASIIYNVDNSIQKTVEIIEQTQRLRKGVMQDLFSEGVWDHPEFQETQYGTIPTEWKIKPIREVANRIGSGGTPDTDVEEYYDGEIAWVKTDDLNSGLVNTTKTKITERGLNESAAKLFPPDTVVFAMYGGALGQNGRLGMEAAMNQACCGIVADDEKIDPYLLHQQLIHRKQQLTSLSAGTHQQNISQSMIEKFEVFVPSLEEQTEMVEILRDLEQTINKYRSQKVRIERLKRGLMQDLLSGEVRTDDRDIDVLPGVEKHG